MSSDLNVGVQSLTGSQHCLLDTADSGCRFYVINSSCSDFAVVCLCLCLS